MYKTRFLFVLLIGMLGLPACLSAADIPNIGAYPPILLIYKYAPESLGNEFLLEQARQQVARDQAQYRTRKQMGDRAGPYNFMFTEQQVKDRQPQFAARDLLPEYKRKLGEWAAEIPDTFIYEMPVNLSYLEYGDGLLRSNSRTGQGPGVIYRHTDMRAEDKLKLPPLGPRTVIPFPHGYATSPDSYPESVARARSPGRLWLAVDRERCSIVTFSADFAIAGTKVMAVAPLPMITTRLPA